MSSEPEYAAERKRPEPVHLTAFSGRFYRPELDWLRFLAFSMVFFFHVVPAEPGPYIAMGVPVFFATYVLAPLVRGGGHGVELFFVLSAFLISELLMRERAQTGGVHIKAFYIRRILRIWPLYFVFIFIVFLYEIAHTDFPISYYVSLIFFVGNWYNVFYGVFFSATGHMWTVSIEEQFYVVWPHIVRHASLRRFVWIMVAMAIIAVALRSAYILLSVEPDQFVVRSNTFMRLDVFAWGGLLACCFHGRDLHVGAGLRALFLSVSLMMYWAVGMEPSGGYQGYAPLWTYLFAGIGSALCISAFLARPARSRLGFPLKALSYLGKISYGLYLWHYPATWIAFNIYDGYRADALTMVLRTSIAAAITLLVSVVSYEFLEKPFLRMKRRYTYVASRPE